MCEAAMAQMKNHNLILNEECSSQENQQRLLAQYARGMLETAQMQIPRDDEDDDDIVDEEEEELEDEEHYEQNVRQSATPQQRTLVDQEVADLKQNMIYLQHQVTLLMNALHVPACTCEVCKPIYQNHTGLFAKIKERTLETSTSKPEFKSVIAKPVVETKVNNARSVIENGHTVIKKPNPAPVQVPKAPPNKVNGVPLTPSVKDCEAWIHQVLAQTGVGALTQANLVGLTTALGLGGSPQKPFAGIPASNNNYSAPNPGGRKSKYCSPAEKKAVADYANLHGASAAARKFNIPPAVAAYYHRKEYKKTAFPLQIQQPTVSIESPGTTSGDDLESNNGDWAGSGQTSAADTAHSNISANPQSLTGVTEMFKQMEQHQKLNPAHSTGSPGFLRGRGRGRPKLIGDELDAELVDYMVRVKQSDPRGHLTASQALSIAREYILEKAPGLLEEHGGQIKLKLTWAMKLVTRISERQKEIELGLPAGTISNMSRTISGPTLNLPGGNFMADMMAQNILNQQMTQFMSQAISGTASATPEILNVRELELPKHSESEKGEVMGELDYKQSNVFKQNDDGQYDDDMELQENEGVGENDSRNQTNEQMEHFISANAF